MPKILQSRPHGLQWRASPWFITLGIAFPDPIGVYAEWLCLSHISRWDGYVYWDIHTEPLPLTPSSPGITTDYLIYSIIIPVMPFHLQALGYSDISVLVGYLLFAYVRIDYPLV